MSTRFVTTPAVILKTGDYSETSRLATAFTRDLGKVRLIAKGARRRKSPFAGLVEPHQLKIDESHSLRRLRRLDDASQLLVVGDVEVPQADPVLFGDREQVVGK